MASTVSKRVEVRPGHAAVAPRVDDPLGFAIQNDSGSPLTVSFSYDTATHIMTVVVEEHRPTQRLPGQASDEGAGQLPV